MSAILAQAKFPLRRLVLDSRRVQAGDTFVACQGEYVDGRRFIPDALARGATSVIWDSEGFQWEPAWNVANLPVPQLKALQGELGAEFYHDPSAQLWVAGITGTNGKTSCSQWLAQILDRAAKPCAVIGTVGNGFIGRLETTTHTTPDPLTVQALLARYREQGASHVAMEVSSHGLDQGRVGGVRFDCAVLTNLSRDHLDYHGSMDAYAASKAKLFSWPELPAMVVNGDDAFGQQLLQAHRGGSAQVLSYGFTDHADIRARSLQLGGNGFVLELDSPWGRATLETSLLGRFNAYNLLAVAGAALLAGVGLDALAAATPGIIPAPGRMQTVGGGEQPLVVIDYAHTPDALEKVLQALREMLAGSGRLIAVFGCGGDRDAGKRPLMGAAVSRAADLAVLTSDNPRSEDPLAIIAAVEAGMSGDYQRQPDRRLAIAGAIAQARLGDIVLVAGKGHEDYQEIDGIKYPFSDLKVSTEALAQWPA